MFTICSRGLCIRSVVNSWTIDRLTVIWRFNGFSMVVLFVAGVCFRWFFISWSLYVHHSAWFSGDQYSVLVLCVHHLVTLCDIIVSGSVLTLYCIRVYLVLSHDKLLYLSSAVCLPGGFCSDNYMVWVCCGVFAHYILYETIDYFNVICTRLISSVCIIECASG